MEGSGGTKPPPSRSSSPPCPQMRMSVHCHPWPVAVPPATTPLVASTVSAPLASNSTRPLGAARMWMSVPTVTALAAMAAPTRLVASCVAVPEVTSGLGKGKSFEWGKQGRSRLGLHAVQMCIQHGLVRTLRIQQKNSLCQNCTQRHQHPVYTPYCVCNCPHVHTCTSTPSGIYRSQCARAHVRGISQCLCRLTCAQILGDTYVPVIHPGLHT